jgi:phosphopantothenoylcysteine decarboxylase/phosphopantothenate--cysteine ligase
MTTNELIKNKKILIGVTGGVAIYKVCDLVRKLINEGANVKVVLSSGAEEFVKPILFSALSRTPTYTDTDFFKPDGKILHIELANFPDLILIAPATASFISKLATGQASELLLAILLASKTPTCIFPSMNTNMLEHPATQENLEKLKKYGYLVYEPATGPLACGITGKGRMPEPEEIFEVVKAFFTPKTLLGKKVLITGGPTREYIDEIRFITNASSGKMAYYLAKEAYYRGAEVHLIWGGIDFPFTLPNLTYISPIPFLKIYFINTTKEMLEIAEKLFPECDIAIFSAAPCDFRPKKTFKGKIKKTGPITLELEITEDIAKSLAKIKRTNQITIGFALEESSKLSEYAKIKKEEKRFDIIVANPLSTMGKETSDFLIFTSEKKFELKEISKAQLAGFLFDLLGL